MKSKNNGRIDIVNWLIFIIRQFTEVLYRSVPETKIFDVTLLLSRLVAFPALLTGIPKEWPMSKNVNDVVLRKMLTYLTHFGARFPVDIMNAEEALNEIRKTYSRNGSMILCSVHFPLNRIIHLVLKESGVPFVVVKAGWTDRTPHGWIWGKEGEVESIQPSHNVLLDVKKRLREGYAVIILVDTGREPKKNVPLCRLRENREKQIYITTNIFRFASKIAAPIVFFSGSMSKGRLRLRLGNLSKPRLENDADIDRCINRFVDFVREEMVLGHGFTEEKGVFS